MHRGRDENQKNHLKTKKREHLQKRIEAIQDHASINMKLAMDLARQKGTSSWLSVLLIDEIRFVLHKEAFWDDVALWYGWHLPDLPNDCVCGKKLTVKHAFTCLTGGLPTM